MNEENIKESIDAIEPEADAKERMYQNIMKKAQKTTSVGSGNELKKKPISFVRYALPVAACFCLLVLGIVHFIPSIEPTESDDSNLLEGNPFVEIDNADTFKEIGITFEAPAEASDISYTIIDEQIASIHFVMNGKNFEARASEKNGDFSGLTGKQLEIKNIDAKNNAILYKINGDFETYYKVTWTNGKVNYCLYGTDGATGDEVAIVYNAFIN